MDADVQWTEVQAIADGRSFGILCEDIRAQRTCGHQHRVPCRGPARKDSDMIADILKDGDARMNKALEALNKNLGTIRTGRANPALLDRIMVEYYGAATPLKQLSNVSTPEARLIVVQPYDRSSINTIEKAIRQSDLGINPSNDGTVIRLAVPPLTEERRKQMVKIVHATVEEGKIAIRNVRRDALSHARDLLTKKEISEDDERRAQTELDTMTKKHVEDADKLGKAKELEVLEV
jgi:ribosome recycling factor